jgi:hypothetical protein
VEKDSKEGNENRPLERVAPSTRRLGDLEAVEGASKEVELADLFLFFLQHHLIFVVKRASTLSGSMQLIVGSSRTSNIGMTWSEMCFFIFLGVWEFL